MNKNETQSNSDTALSTIGQIAGILAEELAILEAAGRVITRFMEQQERLQALEE